MTLGEFLQVANNDFILTLNGNDYRYPDMDYETMLETFNSSLLNRKISLIEIEKHAYRITLENKKVDDDTPF